MVGNQARHRNYCRLMPSLCIPSECRGFGKEGISIFECRHWALASQSFAAYASTKNQTAAEAYAASGLHDAIRSGAFSMDSQKDATLGEILSGRLVHGEPSQRDNGPEVVDGES